MQMINHTKKTLILNTLRSSSIWLRVVYRNTANDMLVTHYSRILSTFKIASYLTVTELNASPYVESMPIILRYPRWCTKPSTFTALRLQDFKTLFLSLEARKLFLRSRKWQIQTYIMAQTQTQDTTWTTPLSGWEVSAWIPASFLRAARWKMSDGLGGSALIILSAVRVIFSSLPMSPFFVLPKKQTRLKKMAFCITAW